MCATAVGGCCLMLFAKDTPVEMMRSSDRERSEAVSRQMLKTCENEVHHPHQWLKCGEMIEMVMHIKSVQFRTAIIKCASLTALVTLLVDCQWMVPLVVRESGLM